MDLPQLIKQIPGFRMVMVIGAHPHDQLRYRDHSNSHVTHHHINRGWIDQGVSIHTINNSLILNSERWRHSSMVAKRDIQTIQNYIKTEILLGRLEGKKSKPNVCNINDRGINWEHVLSKTELLKELVLCDGDKIVGIVADGAEYSIELHRRRQILSFQKRETNITWDKAAYLRLAKRLVNKFDPTDSVSHIIAFNELIRLHNLWDMGRSVDIGEWGNRYDYENLMHTWHQYEDHIPPEISAVAFVAQLLRDVYHHTPITIFEK